MSDPERGSNSSETQPEVPSLEDLTRWGLSWIDKNADRDSNILPQVKRARLQRATDALDQGDLRPAQIMIKLESDNLLEEYDIAEGTGQMQTSSSPLAVQTYFFTSLSISLERKLEGDRSSEFRLLELGRLKDFISSQDQ